nr:alpha/beta family hydrolase [Candidatus Nitrososphaera gargensis]
MAAKSTTSLDSVCTCQVCNHDFALDCLDCTCCTKDTHSMVLDDMSTPSRQVDIPAGSVTLEGDLYLGTKPGIVVFAHGSGSSRHSPRNQQVASVLQKAGLGTLLFDLLTKEEERIDERTAHLRFDIGLLADRLAAATDWLAKRASNSKIGYFGASTGAAAALVAAAKKQDMVSAVVSRGGRPDLAGQHLGKVRAPTLLIVGGNDHPVLDMNWEAFNKLKIKDKKFEIVPGATHLFEEPGKLEEVARLARGWFECYLHSEMTHA